ncbi:SDR family NAD(P)-dependent oxidoreductase [Streptococcus ovuberis]|uniref:SDR family oxidoreductase n=1 Tax=Streptococcus ovuberis TaxID=1936207 RepID=A0A7X6RZR5_9STRE|nr:SDR family oxidoreductase [Streptococcus ovuberis]NKZ19428.1 SDR family oxidoreductase [Streptococcus ovuberis]
MRTILITGATGGLAQAIVTLLPDDHLILTGRSLAKLSALYGQRPKTTLLEIDLTDPQAIDQMVAGFDQEGISVDILINNAGYGEFKAFDQVSDEEVRSMFEVDVFALMQLSRLIGLRMKVAGKGHIVNISSVLGLMATSKASVYSAAKFAVTGFSSALRLELADYGVYVTTVNPGPIRTGFFDQADPSGTYLKRVERYALNPDQVAARIVRSLGHNQRDLTLPFSLKVAHRFYHLFPTIGDYLARKVFNYK